MWVDQLALSSDGSVLYAGTRVSGGLRLGTPTGAPLGDGAPTQETVPTQETREGLSTEMEPVEETSTTMADEEVLSESSTLLTGILIGVVLTLIMGGVVAILITRHRSEER